MAPTDKLRHPSYAPSAPSAGTMPKQETGVRPARPLGYDLTATEKVRSGQVAVTLRNDGRLGAHVQARLVKPVGRSHSYTVSAGQSLKASWPVDGDYDIQLHGPNGFFRRYAGQGDSKLQAELAPAGSSQQLQLKVSGKSDQQIVVTDAYAGERHLDGNGTLTLDLRASSGWYDVTVGTADGSWTRTFAGHIENGKPSSSDPQLGR